MTDERHPELDDYEPDDRPVRRPMRHHAMRVIVVIGIVGLILPGLVISISTATRTADLACRIAVEQGANGAVDYDARFELWGGDGPGWYCYAEEFDGTVILLRALGLIPAVQYAPPPADGIPA